MASILSRPQCVKWVRMSQHNPINITKKGHIIYDGMTCMHNDIQGMIDVEIFGQYITTAAL